MKTTFKLDGNRKELVKAISEITGEKSKYMRMPTCAYQIGEITVEKDGTVVGDIASIIGELKTRGFEPEQEAVKVKVGIEIGSGRMLRNLINMVYVRGELINRAIGTEFFVPEETKEAIKNLDEVSSIIENAEGIRGLKITEESIIFDALSADASDEQKRTFINLVGMMADNAKEMFRINTVKPSMENEKYEMRTWLLRIGMIGEKHKESRKVLLNNLTGHPAYRTKEAEETAKKKRKESRKMKQKQL